MAFWFRATHYIYGVHADEILAWLVDGGVTEFMPSALQAAHIGPTGTKRILLPPYTS